jgi:hypothetical protein
MDPATLAAAAIAASLPYLISLGKEAAKGAAGAVGKSVWEWVKGKLTSEAGKEAVKDLESGPEDSDNRKAAEATLSKLLKSDPSVLSELAQLLERTGATSTAMTTNIVGNENIVGQASGSASVAINTAPEPPRTRSKAR